MSSLEAQGLGTIPPKLPDESDRAYSYFLIYLLSGQSRTIRQTAEVCGKSASLIEKIAAKHSWTERVGEYDQQFLIETALEIRKKNINRFEGFFEKNITQSEKALDVSEMVLTALEKTVREMDSPDFSNKISKILSASKACELLSRTTKNNRDLYIGLMGLEAVAKELLERAKNNNDQGKTP